MFEENIHEGRLDAVRLKARALTSLPLKKKNRTGEASAAARPASEAKTPVSAAARQPRSRSSRPFFLRLKFWLLLIVAFGIGGVAFYGLQALTLAQKIFQNQNPLSLFSGLGQLIKADDRRLTGEDTGQVNILLLGIGGEGHDGALLTDTMILATIKIPKDDSEGTELSLVSIPRDYQARLPAGLEFRKINSAYAYGELGGKKLGATWALQAAQDLAGVSIPYYALVDFSAFKKAVEDLGGVDVVVDRTFTDSSYPNNRYGYLPTIKFEKGEQHLDGERALQFTRSRHGTNGEGSDFARSRRQQKVLEAMKDKALKLNLAADLPTITKLAENFADHFRTNLQPWELKRLYDLGRHIKNENMLNLSLDPTTSLICPQITPENGAYILTPCPGKTKNDIHSFFARKFLLARLLKETPRLEIQNSTKSNGLAQKAKLTLETAYLETSISNYLGSEQIKDTVLYDLTGAGKPQTLRYLQDKFTALTSTAYPNPDKLTEPKPDFIVVLGSDAIEKFANIETPKPRKAAKEPAQSDTAP